MDQSDSNLKGMSQEFEVKALRDKIKELEMEIENFKILLREHDIELEGMDQMSDEEYICIKQIAKLRSISDEGLFDKEQAQVLDLLQKNLKMARGEKVQDRFKMKKKKLSPQELLKVVKDS